MIEQLWIKCWKMQELYPIEQITCLLKYRPAKKATRNGSLQFNIIKNKGRFIKQSKCFFIATD